MAYFESTIIKNDLDITSTDFDADIADWGLKSDNEIDNLLYKTAVKARRITALPELPLTTPPESVKSASNSKVKQKYYEKQKNVDLALYHKKECQEKVQEYIDRLVVDQEIYGRVLH